MAYTIQQLQAMGAVPIGTPTPTSPVGRGYTIDQLQQLGAKPISLGPQSQPQKSTSLFDRLRQDPVLGGVYEGAAGIDKSIAGTVAGIGQLGKNIGNTIGSIPGLSFLKTPDSSPQSQSLQSVQSFSQPSNQAQAIGKGIGDVAQLFTPTGIEEGAAGILGKVAPKLAKGTNLGAKVAKIGTQAIGAGADLAAKTALQTGGDQQATTGAFFAGDFAGAASKALEVFGPGLLTALQKADFKLTPMQAAKAQQRTQSAAQFMVENKVNGTEAAKYSKLDSINTNLESTLQNSIPDLRVKKADLISSLDSSVEKLKISDPAVYSSARADADEAIKTLGGTVQKDGSYTFSGGNTITTEEALAGKRSWGKYAFGRTQYRAVTKDPKVASEGAYAIEQAYQQVFSDSLDRVGGKVVIPESLQSFFGGKSEVSLPEFNKVYSQAISAKNLTLMAQNKKDTGLVGRLFGLWVGESLGQAVAPGLIGKIGGGLVGELGASRIPGVVRGIGERSLNLPASTIPAVTKTAVGFGNANQ